MSKGLGQKIVIKFTEDLVGDVSGKDTATPYSFYRWYITSTWSSSGRLYLYELEFFSNGVKVDTNKIISMAGSSRYSSNYDVDRLFDGSVPGTEWDANGPLPHWVSIELDEAIVIDGFRWHTGTSGNKPKEFILQGSNDGINWVDIHRDESPNLNNWIDFNVVSKGNEIAFTVTGKEYQYVNGPLVDKEYQVESVERYPIQKVWKLDEVLELDNIGDITETVGWNTNSFGIGDPATGTRGYKFKPNNDCLITKLRIFPTETTSTVHLWDVETQTLLATKTFTTITGQWNEIALDIPIPIYNNKEYIVSGNYTLGKNYYRNSNPSQSEFNELTLLGFFVSTSHDTFPTISSTWGNAVDIVMQIGDIEYETPKIYLSEVIQLSGEYRIKWLEIKPQNTDILIEYTTGQTQGQWQEVSNGEVINVDTNLWIRATLSTEDTTITPVLEDLWLEEVSAPQDKILLTMNWWGRFNNVEGDLTVKYDASKGSLSGRGGAVESFTETFTPTDLEPKPNPHVAENIEVSAEASVDFIKVTYNRGYADEQITVSASATVDFIHVSEINP